MKRSHIRIRPSYRGDKFVGFELQVLNTHTKTYEPAGAPFVQHKVAAQVRESILNNE